ncbi:hypothetical protein V5799_014718 [Amblyomma americanum]|uniref:Uncharacterized protein n=1 Tax=Amblyomma americanum TaxID=6943 RepID=A0AAQ4E277_AMBAM
MKAVCDGSCNGCVTASLLSYISFVELSVGITKTYTAHGKTVTSIAEHVDASGHWSAKALYIFTISGSGEYANDVEKLPFVNALIGSTCKSLQHSSEGNYAVVSSCPLFDRDIHQCAFIDAGKESAEYPGCCPLYMCPPSGCEYIFLQNS